MKFSPVKLRLATTPILLAAVFASTAAKAASESWTGGSLANGNWSTQANWSGTGAPGNTNLTPTEDVALFNSPIANTWGNSASNPIVISSTTQSVGGISFTGAAENYVIGSTGGNSLSLSGFRTIQVLDSLTSTNAVFTINAPLLGLSGLSNNSANGTGAGAGTLVLGGGIASSGIGGVFLLSGSNTNANTIGGAIADGFVSTGITKNGTGTWILSGANTYTGPTRLNTGTLTIAFGSVSSNIISPSSSLNLAGGTLQLNGIGTQQFASLATADNSGSRIFLGANQTVSLGAASVGVGSALNFNTAAGGANGTTAGTGTVVITGRTPGAAISHGFTVSDAGGFGLATVNASNQVVRLTSTTLLPASGAISSTDYRLDNNAGGAGVAGSANLQITASSQVNSLTVDTSAANGAMTLASGVVLSNNTWNFGGTGANSWQVSGAAGGAGIMSVDSGNSIEINNYATGSITFAAPLLAHGTNQVNIKGSGTTVFAGINTYTGRTTIRGGALEVPIGGSITLATNEYFIVGSNSGENGTLNLTGGSISNREGILGNDSSSSGTANVSAGTWTNSGPLTIGFFGSGVLNVSGGTVTNTNGTLGGTFGSKGTANISGGTWANSGSITVGGSGAGVLNISGGAVTNTSGTINSNGIANVSAGTWSNSGALNVGMSNIGVLNISGGTVSSGSGTLGVTSGGNGTVNVSAGTWNNSGGLRIGSFGTGVLNISGGAVSNTTGIIGFSSNGNGTANISGGTWTNSAGLSLGASGTGALNLTDNGVVNVGSPVGTGTVTLGSRGTLNLGSGGTAGTLNADTVTSASGTAAVNFNHSGAYTFAPNITGSLPVTKLGSGTATLNGTNTYSGGTTVSGGTLRAGSSSAFGLSSVTVASSATLDLNGFTLGNTVINNGGTVINAVNLAPTQTGGSLNGSINGGTLNGSIGGNFSASGTVAGTPTITGTLKGSAIFSGPVTFGSGAIHAPGNSPGIQTFASGVSYLTGSTLQFEFVGDALTTRGSDYDGVDVTGGDLTIQAGANLALIGSTVDFTSSLWDVSRNFTAIIHSGAGSSTGNFTLDTSLAGTFSGEGIWSVANSSGDIVLTWTPVPEPSTYAFLTGLAALVLVWKRRR